MPPERPQEPLGIFAGGGSLPRIVTAAAEAAGYRPVVLRIADALEEDWSPRETLPLPWGRAGDALSHLRREGVRRIVFCGTVSRRPDYRSLVPSIRTLRILPAALRIVRGGDDSLLRKLATFLAGHGFELLPVQAIAPRLLAPPGIVAGDEPRETDRAALRLALDAAERLGALDIGQAVVASADRVIALEGIEGTREMLERVADLKRRDKLGRTERPVLVKACKPGQDLRFDLPSIGPLTMDQAAGAGLVGVGITAGRSLIIDLDDTLARASAHCLFIWGLDDTQQEAPP